jgi:hypothetical protein
MVIISNHALRDSTGLLPMRLTCDCSNLDPYQHCGSDDSQDSISLDRVQPTCGSKMSCRWLTRVSILRPTNLSSMPKYLLSKRDLALMIR